MELRRLRVGIFIHTLHLGGAEGQVVELLRALDRERFEPFLFCFHAEGHHLARLRELRLEPRLLPIPRSLAHPAIGATILRLAAWCRKLELDVLHPQDFYTNLVAVPAARLAGVGCVVSRLDLSHWYAGLRREAIAWASRLADRVWCNAEAIVDLVVHEDRVVRDRVTLIRNGIDLPRFDAQAALLGPDVLELTAGGLCPCVIQVANMNHPVKGQDDLLVAMDLVRREVPSARLLLVGDGPLRSGFERQAWDLGLRGVVRFAGRRADVPSLLSRATVAVSSSRAEGLSNAVIEAMAARLPVVATAAGGNVELVRSGVTGWLVPPGEPIALANRIVQLLRHPGRARSMGEAGRRFVAAELPLPRMVAEMARLYERVVSDRLRCSEATKSASARATSHAESGPAPV